MLPFNKSKTYQPEPGFCANGSQVLFVMLSPEGGLALGVEARASPPFPDGALLLTSISNLSIAFLFEHEFALHFSAWMFRDTCSD